MRPSSGTVPEWLATSSAPPSVGDVLDAAHLEPEPLLGERLDRGGEDLGDLRVEAELVDLVVAARGACGPSRAASRRAPPSRCRARAGRPAMSATTISSSGMPADSGAAPAVRVRRAASSAAAAAAAAASSSVTARRRGLRRCAVGRPAGVAPSWRGCGLLAAAAPSWRRGLLRRAAFLARRAVVRPAWPSPRALAGGCAAGQRAGGRRRRGLRGCRVRPCRRSRCVLRSSVMNVLP